MRGQAEQRRPAILMALPTGRVIQIYSLYCNVLHEGHTYLCVIRKTMVKVHGEIIVGDLVRFRVDPDRKHNGRRTAGRSARSRRRRARMA